MHTSSPLPVLALLALTLTSCGPKVGGGGKPTAEEAAAFATRADARLKELWVEQSQAAWAFATNITPETEAAASAADEKAMAGLTELVKEAKRYQDVEADETTERMLKLLMLATPLPAPDDDALRKELAETSTKLNSLYATGKVEYKGETLTLDDVSERLGTSRDYDEQLALWEGWHAVAPPMKPLYTRFAELGNQGAKEMGVSDMGALWRSGYDMPPDEFVTEMDRLWGQVNPLYEQLHCAVRAELVEQYGPEKVSPTGPIPAHLLGNMWAQSWAGLYPEMIPYPDQPSLDVTASLVDQGYDAVRMVQLAEGFFTSLGLKPLPQTFWERSMLTRPEGKEVVCHASAWDLSFEGDVRIKMCTRPTMDDLITVHHELGHDYYYLYYYDKPVLFQQGAHDGFHEAIGDTLVLSVTPSYLKQVGLLSEVSDSPEAVINDQLLTALDRVAFLPFGLLMDRWRWGVFSGETSPDEYNASWWALRGQYQGIAPASPRGEEHFDPGAKYHIPAHTPYSRYFLSMILQFQFHKALCDASGYTGPLHQCSIYGSDEAGTRLATMLAMGSSKPWPDALEAMTGTRQMDAGPMLEYFTPLMGYLKEQNKDRQCGW